MPSMVTNDEGKLSTTSCCKSPVEFKTLPEGDTQLLCAACKEPLTVVASLPRMDVTQKAMYAKAKESNAKAKQTTGDPLMHLAAVLYDEISEFVADTTREQLEAYKEKDVLGLTPSYLEKIKALEADPDILQEHIHNCLFAWTLRDPSYWRCVIYPQHVRPILEKTSCSKEGFLKFLIAEFNDELITQAISVCYTI